MLHTEGYRILSLFEILVFIYRWHLQIAKGGDKPSLLAPEGWRILEIDSTGGSPPDSGVPSSDAAPDVSWTPGAVDQTESLNIHVNHAIDFLEAVLVVAVGSRAGVLPQLPSLNNSDTSPGCFLALDTLGRFRCTIDGLQAYAKVTGEIIGAPFTIVGGCRTARKSFTLAVVRMQVFGWLAGLE